ncbi:hypothetical protein D3C83_26540 [compost metagenome]
MCWRDANPAEYDLHLAGTGRRGCLNMRFVVVYKDKQPALRARVLDGQPKQLFEQTRQDHLAG